MQSLTDVYNTVASRDADLEKQAAELYKQAEEEDAAGRIMARGFADELNKLAAPYTAGENVTDTGPKGGAFKGPGGGGVPMTGKPATGGGKTGQGYDPFAGKSRAAAAPTAAQVPAPKPMAAAPAAGKPPQMASAGGAPKPPKPM